MWELYKQLTARVDSALHNELDRHFRNRSQSHQRQWTVLLEKQIQDRDRFATDITNQIMQLSATLRIPAPSILAEKLASISASPEAIQRLDSRPPATLTREQIEKRVRRQSMRHWGEQERVNLKEAFALQVLGGVRVAGYATMEIGVDRGEIHRLTKRAIPSASDGPRGVGVDELSRSSGRRLPLPARRPGGAPGHHRPRWAAGGSLGDEEARGGRDQGRALEKR